MNLKSLLKCAIVAGLALSISPEIQAQTANAYGQYAPTYYYNYGGYQYPAYYGQSAQRYQGYQPQPAQTYQQPRQNTYRPGQTTYENSEAAPRQYAPQAQQYAPRPKQPVRRAAPPQQTVDNQWYNDFNAAWAAAQKQGRPLVALFVHQGCPECERFDQILAQPGAMETLNSAVKVRIEFTTHANLVNRFGLKFTPTFMVFSPSTDGEVYREVGALSLDRLRQLQPSIDSLVTGPQAARQSNADSKKLRKAASQADDSRTSLTVASL